MSVILSIDDAINTIKNTAQEKIVLRDLNLSTGIYSRPSAEQLTKRTQAILSFALLTSVLSGEEGKHVKELDLSINKLGLRGAILLKHMLLQNTTLEKISMFSCRLGSGHDFEKSNDKHCGFEVLREPLLNHPKIHTVMGLDASNWFNPEEKVKVQQFLADMAGKIPLGDPSFDDTSTAMSVDDID